MNKICFIFFVFKWDFLSVSNILLQIPLFKVYAWSNSWFRINLDKKITKIINLWTFKEYTYFFETRPNNEHHSDIIKTWTRSNRNPQSENSHRNNRNNHQHSIRNTSTNSVGIHPWTETSLSPG